MFDQIGELLGTITFSDPDLDKLRQEVLKILASFEVSGIEIDSRTLEGHLKNTGCAALMCGPLRQQVTDHASFARPDKHTEAARIGWEQQFRIFRREQLLTEVRATKERLKKDLNREDFELLKALMQSMAETEETDTPIGETVQGEKSSGTIA